MFRGGQIHQVYIADGFADDCEELIHRCTQVSNLSYEKFCDIWKDMDLICLFHGRSTAAELAELSEEVLHVAKHYMVRNISNFEESVAGLFIVYALLNLQPFQEFAYVRFVQEDLSAIENIEQIARRERRLDVLYILGSVLIRGPCQFHADVRSRGMDIGVRKYLEGVTSIDQRGVRPKGVFYRQNEELDIVRELSTLEQRYSHAKSAIGGSSKDRSLQYASNKLAGELDGSLKKIISGIVEEYSGNSKGDDEENEGSGDHYSRVQKIKDKAMKNMTSGSRHRIGVKERTTEEQNSPSKKDQNKTSPSSIKKSSPTRPVTPKSGKGIKRKAPQKSPKNKKRKMDSDSDEDYEPPPAYNSSSDDLDIENFIKANVETDVNEPPKDRLPQTDDAQELDIEIDKLPALIRSEDNGLAYEIEVIDKQKTDAAPGIDSQVMLKTTSDGTLGQVDGNKTSNSKSKSTRPRKITKRKRIKKPEKRDLKKVPLKYKFRRMGILPMANFEEESPILQ